MRTLVEQTARNVDVWLENVRKSGLDPNGRLPSKGHVLMGSEVDDAWIRHPEKPAILIGTQDMLLSRALMRGYGVGRGRWAVDFALTTTRCGCSTRCSSWPRGAHIGAARSVPPPDWGDGQLPLVVDVGDAGAGLAEDD